jgi:succinate dehydrogenase/fumarate reductase flavoprotein subunit
MTDKRELDKRYSRRFFIKSAAIGAGGSALAQVSPREAAATQINQVSKWDYEAEIVILGTGGAGLVTAITAHDKRADVLILEKAPEAHAGGNTRVSGQGSWCAANLNDSIVYQKALSGGYPLEDDVTQAYHKYTVEIVDWVRKMGFEYTTRPTKGEYPEFPGAPSTVVCFPKEGQGFSRLWNALKENVAKRQIKILYQTPGIELIQETKTREIRGVVAERQGKKIYVKAKKAVVLCTGGFENNQEMIRDYLQMPCGYPKGSPYNTGDGIRMAMAVGADLWHMDNQAGPDLNFKAPGVDWAFGYVFSPPGKGYIWVAKDATRFINETISTKHGKVPYHGIYVPCPTPLPVHLIFDETMRKSGPLYSLNTFFCWYAMIEKYKWSPDSSAELAKGWIIKADTIHDLAEKIGKDPDTLDKTVAAWNASCTAGKDAEFGRPPNLMASIQSPPYYAMEFVPTFTNTQGGPRRNKDSQVLDTNRKPIPRLYSGGELGSVFSYHYQGGGNVAECIAFGRIAGERAAAEKSWA